MQEVLGDFMRKEFHGEDGRLNNFDGLATDALRKDSVSWDRLGLSESEAQAANNAWDLGARALLEELRDGLGDDRILTTDSTKSSNHYAWTSLYTNFETEGITHNDDHEFKSWGTPFNLHSYQRELDDGDTPLADYINIAMVKLPKLMYDMFGVSSREELTKAQWEEYRDTYRERVTIAYSTAMILGSDFGVGNNMRSILDKFDPAARPTELRPGGLGRNWLGKPEGDARSVIESAPELLEDGYLPRVDYEPGFEGIKRGETQVVRPVDSDVDGDVDNRVVWQGIELPMGDSVLTFQVKTKDLPIADGDARWITVTPANEADHEYFEATYAKADNTGYSEVRVYVRDHPGGELPIQVEVEGGAEFSYKNVSLKAGADVWYREYKRGLVFSNPSDQAITINLDELGIEGDYRNLKANRWELDVMNERYDGEEVGRTITLPPLSGIFLEKVKNKRN
ncbi:MAG: hypothetical protein HWE20_10410 [Gammaproteobacteria bacterium]|nr:hypothetical protein [Gammaproteobacteria bacterium]